MPHLTVPTTPRGPIIDVVIAVSIPRQQALYKKQQPVPAPVTARALVDTGASCSCIDPTIAIQLGLVPTSVAQVHTPSTQGVAHQCKVYDISLIIPTSTGSPFRIVTMPAFESNLEPQGISVLLGRDVLRNSTVFYDGPNDRITLSF